MKIERITTSLRNKNSYGFDGLNIKAIKAAIPFISNILSNLINISLQTGIVPDNLKIAKVIPLYISLVIKI